MVIKILDKYSLTFLHVVHFVLTSKTMDFVSEDVVEQTKQV